MAEFTINSLANGGTPASTDNFLKSDAAGGLTKVTTEDLKNAIVGTSHQLDAFTNIDDVLTEGTYIWTTSVPAGLPTLAEYGNSYTDGNKWGSMKVYVEGAGPVQQDIFLPIVGMSFSRYRTGSPAGWGKWLLHNTVSGAVNVEKNDAVFTFKVSKPVRWQTFIILTSSDAFLLKLRSSDAYTATAEIIKIGGFSETTCTASIDVNAGGLVTLAFSNSIAGGIKILGNFS
ncbi:hypothetical protein [Selenomonas ruminantium]|uniref:hypothetical protein n=1 Tax=Selenomonas ruminantium TaxID=971 RepID=UPI0015694E77|nr:hypothetical protein [Selenomonas ruminantium]